VHLSPRPLSIFFAMLACAAPSAPAGATSAVETVRALERRPDSVAATDVSPSLPESPLAIARVLTQTDGWRIELERDGPEPRDDTLLRVSLDIVPR
jgi:hypothetical protein